MHLTCIICRFFRFFAHFPLAQYAKREKGKAPQTAQPCGLWGFLFWPARRDSNPRPLESESTAISSFATGGYDVSFEYENHYTPSFRKWQEENARSMKKRAGSVHSRQKAAAAPSGSGGRRLALVLCVAGDERQRRAGLDPIEIPAALSVDGGDHHRVLTGALQRDLPIDVVGHDRGRAVELHRERAAVA